MHIYISEEAAIKEIQEKFHALYPYLKLEFYRRPHSKGEYSPEEDRISPGTPIEDIRTRCSCGWIDINNYRTAAAVEHDFNHFFGLNVQILRKAGTLWQETINTDNWTLEKLNNAGRSSGRQRLKFPEKRDDD